MEPVSMLLGGTLVLAGWTLGRINRKKPAPDLTVCPGCEHSLSFRDKTTGRCLQQIKRASKWDRDGDVRGYEWVTCGCTNHASAEQITLDASWNPHTLPHTEQ
jgi:hypothetical protein